MLALNRAFQLELENQALEGLLVSPLSRTSLYWGKLLANLVFVALVEAVGLPLFVLFFDVPVGRVLLPLVGVIRSEEHTSELQSHSDLVCRLLLEKKKNK